MINKKHARVKYLFIKFKNFIKIIKLEKLNLFISNL